MMSAICSSTCYESGGGVLYERDHVYDVDETDEWIQRHFVVPQTAKKKKEPAEGGDIEPAESKAKREAAGKKPKEPKANAAGAPAGGEGQEPGTLS